MPFRQFSLSFQPGWKKIACIILYIIYIYIIYKNYTYTYKINIKCELTEVENGYDQDYTWGLETAISDI